MTSNNEMAPKVEIIIQCKNCSDFFSIDKLRVGEKYCPACQDWFDYKAEVESD